MVPALFMNMRNILVLFDTVRALMASSWLGNDQELKAVVESAAPQSAERLVNPIMVVQSATVRA